MALTLRAINLALTGGVGSGTLGDPWDLTKAIGDASGLGGQMVAGDVGICFGTLNAADLATVFVPTNSGSATSPIALIGANAFATPLAAFLGRTFNQKGFLTLTNHANLPFTSGALNLSAKAGWGLCNLNVSSSALNAATVRLGQLSFIEKCKVNNSTSNTAVAAVSIAGNGCHVIDNDLSVNSASSALGVVDVQSTAARIKFNRISGGGAAAGAFGVRGVANFASISHNLIYNLLTGVLGSSSGATWGMDIEGNVIHGCTTGISLPTSPSNMPSIMHNIFSSLTTGILTAAVGHVWERYNRFINCTTNMSGFADWAALSAQASALGVAPGTDITTAGSDFVAPAAPDYNFGLLTASPARRAGLFLNNIGAAPYETGPLTELTSRPDTANVSLEDAIMWLLMSGAAPANKRDAALTAGGEKVYNAAGTVIATTTYADDGTTGSQARWS